MLFAVSILYESQHSPETRPEPLWEESIRIVEAVSEEDARLAGESLGRQRLNSYIAEGSTVTWVFRGVQNVFPLDQDGIRPGMEVFSRFLRDAEALSLLKPFEDSTT